MVEFSIEERVIRLFEDLVYNENCEITTESTWQKLGLDSLDKIEMAMDLEDEFNIVVPDEIMTHLECVGDVSDYIERVISK
jgi:acyl carrier protein